ncbi:unnamed protein product [Orchesella dallaii]|uniref:Uncharacterized protein n=1 Tax=Orchesella dallaii TaxID=48710 RepID=A0ABP1QQ95_9HEXA
MGNIHRQWQEELVGIAWINVGLVVMSLPLFSIYIVQSLQGENVEDFVLHTERGQHFVEIIVKYFVTVLYWVPMSILLKIGATTPSFTLIQTCSIANLIFIFVLALQMIVKPPASILVVCAYAVCFAYMTVSLWIMKCFMETLKSEKTDVAPITDDNSPMGNTSSSGLTNCENCDELNDVADQRFVFRLQPLSKVSTSRSKF